MGDGEVIKAPRCSGCGRWYGIRSYGNHRPLCSTCRTLLRRRSTPRGGNPKFIALADIYLNLRHINVDLFGPAGSVRWVDSPVVVDGGRYDQADSRANANMRMVSGLHAAAPAT